jgi:hypothetical protein
MSVVLLPPWRGTALHRARLCEASQGRFPMRAVMAQAARNPPISSSDDLRIQLRLCTDINSYIHIVGMSPVAKSRKVISLNMPCFVRNEQDI